MASYTLRCVTPGVTVIRVIPIEYNHECGLGQECIVAKVEHDIVYVNLTGSFNNARFLMENGEALNHLSFQY